MTRKDAIEAIKCNWPDSRYTILREALDMAVKALEDVTDKYVGKMTNADRIRAMEGEKLAGFLAGVAGDKIGGTAKYWLQWLQQPAGEEDKHETN